MPAPDTFTTPRLFARRARASDLEYVAAVDTDPVMAKWLGGTISTRGESEARLARWLDEARQTGLGFWIFFRNEHPIGHGGLFTSQRDPGYTELGYAVLPDHWGNGYATEMAQAFLDIARAEKLERVIALTRDTNLRSQRVLEKIGMKLTGALNVDRINYVRYFVRE